MTTLEDKSLWEAEADDDVGQDIIRLSPEEINNRTRLLENDIKVICVCVPVFSRTTWTHFIFVFLQVMKSEIVRLKHEQSAMKERIKDNQEKIKMNKQLPYLVGNVVEVK